MTDTKGVSQYLEGWDGLVRAGFVTPDQEPDYRDLLDRYPFRCTAYYLSLANMSDESDPILRQLLPVFAEISEDGYSDDPFDESGLSPARRVVQRFKNRALIRATDQCAVRCRHCTRKNVLRCSSGAGNKEDFADALRYLKAAPSIREVLVSGGDPLLLDQETLDWLLDSIHRIDHVEVIRIGTRLPVVMPSFVDEDLCEMLATHRPLWVNTQFNHPRELTDEAVSACDRLISSGIPVSNQTVLLNGVNDSVEVMRDLCNELQRNMIRPYYVFQCDPVKGISHLRVPDSDAKLIADTLRQDLGGLAMPRFVKDLPGIPGKQDI